MVIIIEWIYNWYSYHYYDTTTILILPLLLYLQWQQSGGDGRSPSRGHSAPDLHQSFGALQLAFPDEPEGILAGHPSASTITGMPVKNKKEKKEKKYSKLEESLKTK